MRMFDIIAKKRDGKELLPEEIEFFINGYVSGEIKDYQVSALLMAIYFNGLSETETTVLTMCMAKSGDMVDLSKIPGIKVDKHSTGGVGDKTTLIISPIVAALGVHVAKMSGRGLGHTGGTIDKMESIPNLKTEVDKETFFDIVNKVGFCVIGQSGNIVPADKKLYALRDVTATVDNMQLIAASIMSKKIASGSDCILLDVKVGSGAFMKTIDEAIELAKIMVKIGENIGRKTVALITDMDRPLGFAIGNSLEIIEVCKTLKGEGPEDLTEICVSLAANMLYLAGVATTSECEKLAKATIENGTAFNKLCKMVTALGGDARVLDDNNLFVKSKVEYVVKSRVEGYISSMDTEKCGTSAVILGAGRETKESPIDFSAGIILNKKVGDYVKIGDAIATFYSSAEDKCKSAEKLFINGISFAATAPEEKPIIYARVTKDTVEKYEL